MISADNLQKRREESGYYNLICPVCGREFHRKPSYIKKAKWKDKICCSSSCNKSIRKVMMSGEGNHQYGLRGHRNSSFIKGNRARKNNRLNEVMVYVGEWYAKPSWSGRIPEHRYLVELNHEVFGNEKFENIKDWYYLKDGYTVHHIDGNHSNNSLDNLMVITRSEHTRIHNALRKNNLK